MNAIKLFLKSNEFKELILGTLLNIINMLSKTDLSKFIEEKN